MTASQRRSAAALALPFLMAGVTPDATPGEAWRASSAWSYSFGSATDVGENNLYLFGSVDVDVGVTGSVRVDAPVTGSVRVDAPLTGSV